LIWIAREERERLSLRVVLGGGIAGLAAGAVCAAFVLVHLPIREGQSTPSAAVRLFYPISLTGV
jgi:hypothetical protein